MKVTLYVINEGTAAQYYSLKTAGDNTVLAYAPGWKTKRGAIRWAERHGFEVV